MNTIELKNISKTFGSVVAVNDLNLNVPKGSIYGFIGPNGSGKTTTIRMIMKILYADSGTIFINGNQHDSKRLNNIGYLPEERGLYKKMKVKDVLMFHGELNNGTDLPSKIKKWCHILTLLNSQTKKWQPSVRV